MLNEKILINRLKKRDDKAFEEVYYKYVGLVKYVALQIVKDIEEVEDICQIVFIKLIDNIDNFRGGNLKYYLLQIAKNEARLILRKKQYENKYLEEQKYLENKLPIANEVWESVSKVLNSEELYIFILHFIYNFNFKDIAKELNKGKTTCYNIYKNALNKVKKYLKGDDKNEA